MSQPGFLLLLEASIDRYKYCKYRRVQDSEKEERVGRNKEIFVKSYFNKLVEWQTSSISSLMNELLLKNLDIYNVQSKSVARVINRDGQIFLKGLISQEGRSKGALSAKIWAQKA